ncbi:MAG: ATP-dependent Clp protease proteolytic subunit, partial [Glaciecola sp.]
EDLARDTDRDNFLSAQESLDYGLIDHIMKSRNDIPGS